MAAAEPVELAERSWPFIKMNQSSTDLPQNIKAMLILPDESVLAAAAGSYRIWQLSADLQKVISVVGNGSYGYDDGAATQAQFIDPSCLVLLPDGRVLLADATGNRLRLLSANLQQVSTVAQQTQFKDPNGLAVLPDGRVLVADSGNNRIRVLSADLQQVSTVAGNGEAGYRDGAAADAQFDDPTGLAMLSDGRVLVADRLNGRIRVLSADLQKVSTLLIALLSAAWFAVLSDNQVLVLADQRVQILDLQTYKLSKAFHNNTLDNQQTTAIVTRGETVLVATPSEITQYTYRPDIDQRALSRLHSTQKSGEISGEGQLPTEIERKIRKMLSGLRLKM